MTYRDQAQCPYIPTQGTNAGVQCLLPKGHPNTQAHIHDPAKMPSFTDDGEPSMFTEGELADAISEDEIRRRAEALDDAQGLWERAADRARPKMPCTECTGNGQVFGGSLGDHCPTCHGTRVVYDDSVEVDFALPNFRALREPLTAYGDALTWRRHGKPAALPAASTVPSMDQIQGLMADGRAKHKQLAQGGAPAAPQLPPAARLRQSGLVADGGIDETVDDGEIDALEAEFEDGRGGR